MKKTIIISLFIALLPLLAQGRGDSDGRISIGGSIGGSFSDGNTNLNIAPQIGYNFNRFITLGGGVSYNYSDRDHYSLNYLGANVFAKFYPIRYINIFAQPEIQHRWGKINGIKSSKELFATMLIGGGVVIPTGGRGGVAISVYYDVLQNRYSPYGDNLGYSVGYTFNF